MSAGYPITKTDLDNRIGAMIVNVRDALDACVLFKALLDDSTILGGTALTAAPLSYSAAEDTQIRAAFSSMKSLSDISRGLATQAITNDFWFDAKHLCGLNFH
jgi:hypothetical protein